MNYLWLTDPRLTSRQRLKMESFTQVATSTETEFWKEPTRHAVISLFKSEMPLLEASKGRRKSFTVTFQKGLIGKLESSQVLIETGSLKSLRAQT